MAAYNLPVFFRFLVGVFLLQGATALLLITAQDADLQNNGWLIGALGIVIGVIATLWFSAIASHASQHSFVRASEKFNRQRDRIRRQAEKEKTREIKDSHQQILRETKRLQNRSTLKMGMAMAGIAGLGVLLLFTQFMTFGLLAVSATGGTLLGYTIRARQYPAMGQPSAGRTSKLPEKPAGQGRVHPGDKIAPPHNSD